MSVSNLTGTKWVFNNIINNFTGINTWGDYDINFTSNSNNYTRLTYDDDGDFYAEAMTYDNITVYNMINNTRTNDAYKTIEITGGSDATNSDLITFLENNATQLSTTPTLTFSGDLSSYLTVKVNNVTVSSGYELSHGDKVELFLDDNYPDYEILINGEEVTDSEITVLNEDISIEVNEAVSYDAVFSNNTPQQLAAAFDSGEIPSTWSVGDYIDVTLTNGSIARVMLVHKTSSTSNYKYNDDNTTCPFILSVMNFVGDNHAMNSSSTNAGGWNGSKMRTYVNSSAFLDLFPSDWKSCLAMLKVKAMNGGSQSGTTLVESADKMFLFAEKEYYGAVKNSSATEGNALNQLDYYANLGVSLSNYSALRKGATPTTTSYDYYGERSAHASLDGIFCGVGGSGSAISDSAYNARGVVVGFSLSLTHNS